MLRINANNTHLKPGVFPQSVHAFGVVEAVELSRVLGDIPECLVIYGIEGKEFSHGKILSPEVSEAGEKVTARIVEEIDCLRTGLEANSDA